ncbi:MAG: hypothetical protein EOO17_04665 [Chloroflexi bacterium]|nr:MAG: hypothetical protein EOO17_04665 [Chloroflexota bacterium]
MPGFSNADLKERQRTRSVLAERDSRRLEYDRERERRLATKALSETVQLQETEQRQIAYDIATNEILELAHAGIDSPVVSREDVQDAAVILLENPDTSQRQKDVASLYAVLPDMVEAKDALDGSTRLASHERSAFKKNLVLFNTSLK